jgi:hypothetical protein
LKLFELDSLSRDIYLISFLGWLGNSLIFVGWWETKVSFSSQKKIQT